MPVSKGTINYTGPSTTTRAGAALITQQLASQVGTGSTATPYVPPTISQPSPGRNFYAEVRLLYPWMPDELLRIYADALSKYGGDPTLAWAEVRKSPRYDTYFPGNRRPDGTFRYDESTFMSVVEGYGIQLQRYGLAPSIFGADGVRKWIEGNISPELLGQRLNLAWSGIINHLEGTRSWYAQNYGLQVSDQAVFASFLGADLDIPEIERRVQQAQIGGAARTFGFERGLSRVQELAGFGLTGDQAQQLYGQARTAVPQLDVLARRYYDPAGGIGVEEFEEAAVEQDPEQQLRFRRRQADERSAFSPSGSVAGGQGGLTGLRPR